MQNMKIDISRLNMMKILVDQLGSDLMSEKGFAVSKIYSILGLSSEDVNLLTYESKELCNDYRRADRIVFESQITRDAFNELANIIILMRASGFDDSQIQTWFNKSLPSYNGDTPKEVVIKGEGHSLVDGLLALQYGDTGG